MIKIDTWKVINAHDIGDRAGELLSKSIDGLGAAVMTYGEISNGSTHPVQVPFVPSDKWEQADLDTEVAALEKFKSYEPDPERSWMGPPADSMPGMRVLLNLLHEHGEIEAGDYVIECWW